MYRFKTAKKTVETIAAIGYKDNLYSSQYRQRNDNRKKTNLAKRFLTWRQTHILLKLLLQQIYKIYTVIPRLHDTTGCRTGLTTGLTTGCIV